MSDSQSRNIEASLWGGDREEEPKPHPYTSTRHSDLVMQLRTLQSLMREQSSLFDMITVCIERFRLKKKENEQEKSQSFFIESLRFGPYLHFWVCLLEHERAMLDTKDSKYIYSMQYFLSRPLHRHYKSVLENENPMLRFLKPKATNQSRDMHSADVQKYVKDVRRILLAWVDLGDGTVAPNQQSLQDLGAPEPLMRPESCKHCAAKLYGHIVSIFGVEDSEIARDLNPFKKFGKVRELTLVLSNWHNDATKLRVLKYLLHAWATKNDLQGIPGHQKMMGRLFTQEGLPSSVVNHRTAKQWFAMVILLREMYRTVLLSDIHTETSQQAFFSSHMKTRSDKRKSVLLIFQQERELFTRVFEMLKAALDKDDFLEKVRSSIPVDDMIDDDELILQLRAFISGALVDLEGLTDTFLVEGSHEYGQISLW